jgi:hypothetical protein
MKTVKLSLESEDGKFEIFISDECLLGIMHNDIHDFFGSTSIDAKEGTIIRPRLDIMEALKLEQRIINKPIIDGNKTQDMSGL